MTAESYDYKRLRQNDDGTVDVVGYATEENESSVLYGQTIRHYIGTYPTSAEAQAAHPEATGWYHPMLEPQVSFNHLPDDEDY